MPAATTAVSYGVGRGMDALFGPDVQNMAQQPPAPQAMQGGPAMQILAQVQQQLQAEEQQRQQALMALLTQGMQGPQQAPQQPIQMES